MKTSQIKLTFDMYIFNSNKDENLSFTFSKSKKKKRSVALLWAFDVTTLLTISINLTSLLH